VGVCGRAGEWRAGRQAWNHGVRSGQLDAVPARVRVLACMHGRGRVRGCGTLTPKLNCRAAVADFQKPQCLAITAGVLGNWLKPLQLSRHQSSLPSNILKNSLLKTPPTFSSCMGGAGGASG